MHKYIHLMLAKGFRKADATNPQRYRETCTVGFNLMRSIMDSVDNNEFRIRKMTELIKLWDEMAIRYKLLDENGNIYREFPDFRKGRP